MANQAYSGYGMPEIDFSTLGKLGDIYNKNRIEGGRERTLASLAQGGSLDDLARGLAGAGDFEGALKYATLAETARQHNLSNETATLTPDIKNYRFSQKEPGFTKFLEENGSGLKYGNNPQPVWNEERQQWELLQTNNRGGSKIVDSQGRQVTIPNKGVDTGTGTAIIPGRMPAGGVPGATQGAAEPLSGGTAPSVSPTPVQTQVIPKDLVGKEAQKDAGKIITEAQAKLPQLATDVTNATGYIDQLLKHPGKSTAVGFIMGRVPALTPAAADFRERLSQIDSAAWSGAVQTLRGLGALSDKEGEKLASLKARLSTVKSEEDFNTALEDARKTFQQGYANLKKIASGSVFVKPQEEASQPEQKRLRFNPTTGDFE